MSGVGRFVELAPTHLMRLMVIERRSFASPWTEDDFRYLLGDSGALCLGLWAAEELIGYALGYCEGRDFHLASIAVDPKLRRLGWAWQLLEQVLCLARARGCSRCALEVRSTNRAALQLYAKAGFRSMERRKAHYSRPRDDGIIMERAIEIL